MAVVFVQLKPCKMRQPDGQPTVSHILSHASTGHRGDLQFVAGGRTPECFPRIPAAQEDLHPARLLAALVRPPAAARRERQPPVLDREAAVANSRFPFRVADSHTHARA